MDDPGVGQRPGVFEDSDPVVHEDFRQGRRHVQKVGTIRGDRTGRYDIGRVEQREQRRVESGRQHDGVVVVAGAPR